MTRPKPVPLEKLVEKRLRGLLDGTHQLNAPEELDAIKLGIDWIKAQKREKQGPMGDFFNEPELPDERSTDK